MIDFELQNDRIVIGDLIITELLQGFRSDADYNKAKGLINKLEYRDFVGIEIAIQAANNFRNLRKKGITVRKTIDVLIATFCIENNLPLLHNDGDFDPMEEYLGLTVIR